MSAFNICIIRPQGYLFSSVFFELAELIAFSLEDNGHSVRIAENHLDSSAQNLVIGCHLIDIQQTSLIPRGTIILNTEQIGVGHAKWNQRVIHFLKQFPSWDYSHENIAVLKQLGITSTRFFQIGYHPRLNRIRSDIPNDIDVLFYGALNSPRTLILDAIEKRGAKVTRLFGVFGNDRDQYIARSKVVLNLHQHSTKIFEIVRAHYLMNNKKVIISQFDADTKIDSRYAAGLILSKVEDIAETCIQTIHSDQVLKEFEQRSLDAIMKFDSVKIMQDLIAPL